MFFCEKIERLVLNLLSDTLHLGQIGHLEKRHLRRKASQERSAQIAQRTGRSVPHSFDARKSIRVGAAGQRLRQIDIEGLFGERLAAVGGLPCYLTRVET